MFKISPDETLNVVQELYENKLVTYPRTDARVLSTAVAKEIHKNIGGLQNYSPCGHFAVNILKAASYKGIEKTKLCGCQKNYRPLCHNTNGTGTLMVCRSKSL